MALECRQIKKSFGSNSVLNGVDLDFPLNGTFTGLLGANGAGKSTLMKIITGEMKEYDGELFFEGKKYQPNSPLDALKKGIYRIPQELGLLKHLTVLENILLGREEASSFGILKQTKNKRIAQDALGKIGLEIDLDTPVEDLTSAQQQLVAIARALSFESKLIVLDEPTSMLTEEETQRLRKVLLELKAKGVSAIYITHRLSELEGLVDQVCVLRDGFVSGECKIEDSNYHAQQWVEWMAGTIQTTIQDQDEKELGPVVLRVENLVVKGNTRIDFQIRKGEILGLIGLVGSGRSEVLRAISGADRPIKGRIWINGKEIHTGRISESLENGILWSPEDRRKEGLLLDQSVGFNALLQSTKAYSNKGWLKQNSESECMEEVGRRVPVDIQSIRQLAGTLSGGNQQRLILGKILNRGGDVLLLDEITSGVDVGTKAEILELVKKLSREGKAILLVSSEWEEVLKTADRVLVLDEGKIVKEFEPQKEHTQPLQILKTIHHTKRTAEASA